MSFRLKICDESFSEYIVKSIISRNLSLIITFKFTLISIISIILIWLYLVKPLIKALGDVLGSILAIVFFISIFKIIGLIYDIYARTDRLIFSNGSNGAVQLQYSALKIPKNSKDLIGYCSKFTDQSSHPITEISIQGKDEFYCGLNYYRPDEKFLYPYKKMENGDILLWTAPEKRVICKSPCKITPFEK